jgi:hypothetical protein
VETVCSTCGEQNPPGTQFCWSCRAYLGWQDDPSSSRTAPVAGPTPVIVPTSDEPPSSVGGADERRDDPFETGIADDALTVPVDGAPVTLTVTVSNTSSVVDGYVVEGLNAPPWLEVRPGTAELLPSTSGTVTAELRIVSSALVPAQQLPLLVRLRNTTGRFAYRDMAVQVTVPIVEAPFVVRTEPRLIRAHDHAAAVCTVVVENPRSNRWARVRLSAADPEQAVRSTWHSPELDVPPGGEARTDVRFDAPAPAPGGEVSRQITVTAAEGQQRAETTVTLTQSASRAAIELLSLRLDPTVLRLGARHRGQMTAVIDNRGGDTPVSLSLRGDDPENSLGFSFSPATVQVPPGQQAAVRVTVTAPRTPPGQEVTRPLTILASDGRSDTRVDGSVIQLASSRRGLARVLLTVLGGLAMILGSLLTFVSNTQNSAVELTAEEISREVDASHPEFGIPDDLNAMGVENVVSIGLVLIILGGLVIFGLTGRTGRLTRVAALLGAVVVVATFVGSATVADGSGPASGAVLAFAGCVAGYIGGLLARR